MKNIIINNLSTQDLSTIMYGDEETLCKFTEKEINELLKSNAKELQAIYASIDEENYKAITPGNLYILGDTINMLNATKYKKPSPKPLNYRQSLNKVIEQKINVLMLEVAEEVDCIFNTNKKLSNKDFEIACTLVHEAYLKSEELNINQISRALYKLICEDNKPLADITKRMLISEACYM